MCNVVKALIVSGAQPTKGQARSPIELFWTAKKMLWNIVEFELRKPLFWQFCNIRGGPLILNGSLKPIVSQRKRSFLRKPNKFCICAKRISLVSSRNDLLIKVLRTASKVIGKMMLQIDVSHNMYMLRYLDIQGNIQ